MKRIERQRLGNFINQEAAGVRFNPVIMDDILDQPMQAQE